MASDLGVPLENIRLLSERILSRAFCGARLAGAVVVHSATASARRIRAVWLQPPPCAVRAFAVHLRLLFARSFKGCSVLMSQMDPS